MLEKWPYLEDQVGQGHQNTGLWPITSDQSRKQQQHGRRALLTLTTTTITLAQLTTINNYTAVPSIVPSICPIPYATQKSNVYDKRADNISEPIALLYLITTILNYYTTTLGTNYNYIRNS